MYTGHVQGCRTHLLEKPRRLYPASRPTQLGDAEAGPSGSFAEPGRPWRKKRGRLGSAQIPHPQEMKK